MFVLIRALAAIFGFLRLPITPVKTTIPPSAAEVSGAMMTQDAIVRTQNDLKNNSSPVFGNFNLGIYNGVTNTLSAADIVGGFIRRAGPATNNDLTDTATNIVGAIPGAVVGQTFPFFYANIGLGTATIQAGTGVSLTGTATIGPLMCRAFMGQVTGSAAVRLTNMFSFPAIGI